MKWSVSLGKLNAFVPRVIKPPIATVILYGVFKSTISQNGRLSFGTSSLQAHHACHDDARMLVIQSVRLWGVCNSSPPRYNFQIIKLKCYIIFLPLSRKSLWVCTTFMNRSVNPDENNNKSFLRKSRSIRMRYCTPSWEKKRKLRENVEDGNERNFPEWKWMSGKCASATA